MTKVKPPFCYFGGKSKIASKVWELLGDPRQYIEPFCGSAAVLLARESSRAKTYETINDLDGFVSNFFRAAKLRPEEVQYYNSWAISELDYHALSKYVLDIKEGLVENLRNDLDYCDPKLAGLWARFRAHEIGHEMGNRITRSMPSNDNKAPIDVHKLARRLQQVRILCGDWQRPVASSASLFQSGSKSSTGIFFDPPYGHGSGDLYPAGGNDSTSIVDEVFQRSLELLEEYPRSKGYDVRIVIACYEDGRETPEGWTKIKWMANKGLARSDKTRRAEERLFASPGCTVQPDLISLLAG